MHDSNKETELNKVVNEQGVEGYSEGKNYSRNGSKISRQALLDKDLANYQPKRWGLNIPFRDYTLRPEDLVPAISGAIGKVALVAGFAVAWASALGITDPTFVTENVRLEIIVGSILTLLFSAFLAPHAAPAGTLAPLLPMVPLMAKAGVHPLILGLLIGALGLLVSGFKLFDKLRAINGPGAKSGIILLFGIMGVLSSINSLRSWATSGSGNLFMAALLIPGFLIYILAIKYRVKWLIIPVCALAALGVGLLFKAVPEMTTSAALPILNPSIWWHDKWRLGFGLSFDSVLRAAPFALLAVAMWPTDALVIETLQRKNYRSAAGAAGTGASEGAIGGVGVSVGAMGVEGAGEAAPSPGAKKHEPEFENAIFSMNATLVLASIRSIVGAFLGGSQTSAIWRSFMIPLATVRRPIPGSALLLGIMGIIFALTGAPLDVVTFPPLIYMVLVFGIYLPLLEVGLNSFSKASRSEQGSGALQPAILCIVAGLAFNPVVGWALALGTENFGLVQRRKSVLAEVSRQQGMPLSHKILTVFILILAVGSLVVSGQ